MRARFARAAALAGLLLGLAGCSHQGANVGVGVRYLDREPPRSRVEVRGVRPSSGFVWIPGYHRWTGRDFDWVPGRWSGVAPGYRSWSPGHWKHNRHGWYWVDGRWR